MKKKPENTFYLISLGCAKNSVDSAAMAGLMEQSGVRVSEQPEKADYLIVNTCGFIEDARQESLQVLRELAKGKKKRQRLIAAGCLSQRYAQLVAEQISGVDAILGTRRWMDIMEVVDRLRDGNRAQIPYYHDSVYAGVSGSTPQVAIQGASAYVKIADGCRRSCAYCAIPLIKGTLASRPMQAIIDDLHYLEDNLVNEAILIAQDTTDYGHDLGMQDGITVLLKRALAETDLPWLRLLYTYPGYVSNELIDLMAAQPRLLPYIDMPLQHANPHILKSMGRPADLDWIHRTVTRLRDRLPEMAIRSTFIVGYPGETEAEFNDLLAFFQEIKFDRVGAFAYSFEAGTPAEPLGDPVPAEVKQERLERLMTLQSDISLQNNQRWLGKTLDVLVEGVDNGISVGRSFRDAPEIDGYVIVEGSLPVGRLSPVRITGAMTHDLTGIPV